MENDIWKICSIIDQGLPHLSISMADFGSQRNSKGYQSALPLSRGDLQFPAQTLRPRPHAQKSLTLADLPGVESGAIVFESQCQPAPFDVQLDLRLSARGVSSYVVDGLLENQKNLAAHVGADF